MSALALHRIVLASPVLLGLLPQAASAEEAKFRITANWTTNYVEPKPRSVLTRKSYLVTLKADGTVTERTETWTGNRWVRASLVETDSDLGVESGASRKKIWKVVNETTLVRLLARKSHTFVIWIRTQGKDSCTTTIEWRLKPGFTLFEAPQKPGKPLARFTEPNPPDARCDVL